MPTRSQQKVFNAIQVYIAAHGHGPTLTEIGERIGIRSKGTVHRHVKALIDQGYLQQQGGWRGINLSDKHDARLDTRLPLLGRIAAGKPIDAIPGHDEIDLNELFAGVGRYALKIQGDSMIDAGIMDGDTVIIERRDTANDGDIVVALIDDEEATLKRLKRHHDGRIELIPENISLSPLIYDASRVRIQGILVGQLRFY